MKFFSIIFLIAIFAFQPLKKKKVIFFGDSITQAGAELGGYITKIDSLSKAEKMNENFELIGKGIGGNKVHDLYLRLQSDVLDLKPDVVIIYIGINDIWHKFTSGTGTEYDKFGKFYDAIVYKLKQQGIQPIVCTPTVIGERYDNSNQQDGDLNRYSNWIRNYAAKNNLPFVDLRKSFMDYIIKNNADNKEKDILTTDRVHLNNKGNLLVAQEIWKVLKTVK